MKKVSILCFVNTFLLIQFAHASRPIRGTYEVPTEAALKPYSSYPVHFKGDDYDSNPSSISFPMPVTLVGQEKIVTLQKTATVLNGENVWVGLDASGTCQRTGRYFICNMKFQNPGVDIVKVEENLKLQFPNPVDVQNRLLVSGKFGNEPIGILTYKLKGKFKFK